MSPTDWRSSAGGIGPSRIFSKSAGRFLIDPAGSNRAFLPAKIQGVKMSRFRRILQRFIKPAAMVGVVGTLSLALVVTTPSNAYAFQKPLPVKPNFIMGAVKTIAPVAMAAVSVTPVGWGLRIYQLAMLAFSTSDMWMPYVTGAFGDPKTETTNTSTNVLAGFKLGSLSNGSTTRAITFTYSYTGSSVKTGYPFSDFQCRQTQAANGKAVGDVFRNTFTWSIGSMSPGTSGSLSGNACPQYSEIISGSLGAGAGVQEPMNTLYLGGGVGAFNPRGNDVTYRGQSECIDSAGVKTWISGPDVPGDNGAMLMPSCEAAGKGHGTGHTKVTAFKPDGGQETVWDTGAQPLSDPATPLCDPGRTSSGCLMEVLKDDQPCVPGDVECENWQEESGKDPTRWKCKLGPYTLPLSACNLLARAYSPNGAPLNDANTDADPATNSNLGPDGQPAPAPAPAVTGTGTGAAPAPGGAGQTSPSADEKARQCFPTGWAAFNPVEWVLKPVRCAFEPSKDTSDMQRIFRDKLQQRAPVSWITAAGALEAPGGGGCPNWVVQIPGGFSQNVVCESSYISALVGIRLPLFGLLATAMVWPLIRSLWYAAIPVLRVTPSGGK